MVCMDFFPSRQDFFFSVYCFLLFSFHPALVSLYSSKIVNAILLQMKSKKKKKKTKHTEPLKHAYNTMQAIPYIHLHTHTGTHTQLIWEARVSEQEIASQDKRDRKKTAHTFITLCVRIRNNVCLCLWLCVWAKLKFRQKHCYRFHFFTFDIIIYRQRDWKTHAHAFISAAVRPFTCVIWCSLSLCFFTIQITPLNVNIFTMELKFHHLYPFWRLLSCSHANTLSLDFIAFSTHKHDKSMCLHQSVAKPTKKKRNQSASSNFR